MVQVIDGKDATLGRMASYVAKELLKGEKMVIVNCDEVIITGNKKNIKDHFAKKRTKVGSGQKGPKYSMVNEKIVKRAVRGMIGNHRKGRGKVAYGLLRCHNKVPEEYKNSKTMTFKNKNNKFIKIKDIYNKNEK